MTHFIAFLAGVLCTIGTHKGVMHLDKDISRVRKNLRELREDEHELEMFVRREIKRRYQNNTLKDIIFESPYYIPKQEFDQFEVKEWFRSR